LSGASLGYYRGRYYRFDVGMWQSQDPLRFDAGDSNLYRYVSNAAVNATDPMGLDAWADDGVARALQYLATTVEASDGLFHADPASVERNSRAYWALRGPMISAPQPPPQPHPLYSGLGAWALHYLEGSPHTGGYGMPFHFTVSGGVEFELDLIFLHFHIQGDINIGIGGEDWFGVGVGGSAGVNPTIGFGGSMSFEGMITNAHSQEELHHYRQTELGYDLFHHGLSYVEGIDENGQAQYQGFTVTWSPHGAHFGPGAVFAGDNPKPVGVTVFTLRDWIVGREEIHQNEQRQ
jgi:hypothetical protein